VIDGADAGGEEEPHRRVPRHFRVENHGLRNHVGMAEHLLGLRGFVGDAGDVRELAGRQGRGNRDLPHRGRHDGVRRLYAIERGHVADIIGEAKLHRLGGVGDRAATQRHDEIGVGRARLLGRRDHRGARRVRRHLVEGADTFVAERAADLLDLVGLAIERAAHHQKDALRSGAQHQVRKCYVGGRAVDHFVHLAEYDSSGLRHHSSGGPSALLLLAYTP